MICRNVSWQDACLADSLRWFVLKQNAPTPRRSISLDSLNVFSLLVLM